MTTRILKRLGSMIPALRRLREERNRYSHELAELSSKLARANTAIATLVKERDRLAAQLDLIEESSRAPEHPPPRTARRLHVVGYARSGTTILMDILNSSTDVFVFSELNLHVLRRFPDAFADIGGVGFLEQFLARKRREFPAYKGGALHLPSEASAAIQLEPDAYLDRLARTHRYVGDKIAVAHRAFCGVSELEMLDDFLGLESNAVLLFTLRRPSENLASVRKLFPDSQPADWARSIAKTNMLLVRRFLTANRAHLVFHEDIGPGLVDELQLLLGTQCGVSPKLVGASHQASRGESLIPQGGEAWMSGLDRCHDRLHEIWACDNSILKRSRTEALVKAVERVLGEMQTLVDAARAA